MARDTFGSVQSITLAGVTYDCPADVNVELVRSLYKTEFLASTGRNIAKKTRQVPEAKSVVVFANDDELTALKGLAEQTTDFTIAAKLVSGSVYRTSGQIDLESWETMEGKAKLTLLPRTDWTPFVNP